MPELTPAQKKKRALLETQSDAVAEGRSTSTDPTPETVSLDVMLGEGDSVLIGNKQYEVAAFPVGNLAKAGKLLSECPEMLLAAAVGAAETGELSAAKTAEVLNRMAKSVNSEAPQPDASVFSDALDTLAMNITEMEAAAMTPLAVLALSRRHPDITAGDIENDLDLPTFTRLLCLVMKANEPLRKRF